jgi:hypothetical protein
LAEFAVFGLFFSGHLNFGLYQNNLRKLLSGSKDQKRIFAAPVIDKCPSDCYFLARALVTLDSV